jgi:DsbC/DsbD-like thiol-disulfide interchange protein
VRLETKTFLSKDSIHAGETFKAALSLMIGPGWHINANPVNDDFLVPTTVDLSGDPNFKLIKLVYPAPFTAKFDFSEADAVIYSGSALFGMLIKANDRVPPGTYKLKGSLMYQACNEKACLAPETIGFELVILVVDFDQETREINTDVFAAIDFKK